MVKCKYCGEMNLEDGKYCARCGQELPSTDNTAMKDTLLKAQKSFDRDSLVNLERSRITYVCTVCGHINSIEQDRCDTCGKPRPRSEYVTALKKLKQAGKVQTEQQKPIQQPQTPIEEEKTPEEEVVQPQTAIQNFPQTSGGQAPAVVQPFVVVPYVNTQQPLWQYRTNQVYRFQPYTQEEIAMMQEQAAKAQGQELTDKTEKTVEDEVKPKGTKRVRVTSLLTLIVSIAMIICMYLVPYTKSASDPAIFYLSGIVECFRAFDIVLTNKFSAYTYLGWYSFIPPILFAIAIILLAALIVRSVIRLFTGKAKVKGFVLPLFIFLTVFGAFFGIVAQVSGYANNGFANYFQVANVGTYLIPALALVLIIIALFNKANEPKSKKKDKSKKGKEKEKI